MAAIAAPPGRTKGPLYVPEEDDPLDLIEEIAEYRAQGSTWEATADRFDHELRDLRLFVRKHNAEFRKHLNFYRREHIQDSAMESLLALRTRLRSKDDRTAIAAAAGVVKFHCTHIRHLSRRTSTGEKIVLPYEEVTEDVFAGFVADYIEDRAAEDDDDAAGEEGTDGVDQPDGGGKPGPAGGGAPPT